MSMFFLAADSLFFTIMRQTSVLYHYAPNLLSRGSFYGINTSCANDSLHTAISRTEHVNELTGFLSKLGALRACTLDSVFGSVYRLHLSS